MKKNYDSVIDRYIEKCLYFVENVFKYKNFKKAVVGISGGLDSAVITALCVKVLGKDNVFGYMLPCGPQHDIADSELICKTYGIKSEKIDIHNIVESFRLLEENVLFDKTRIGNIKARVRMIILYDKSMKHNALVVGTGNKTELMLGYFTIHGDGACALEPIGHLFKTEVRAIAKKLGVPKRIITKPPSAGLWKGQTDEEELGCSYNVIDKILAQYEEFRGEDNVDLYIAEKINVPISVVRGILDKMVKNSFKSKPPMVLGKLQW
jgi:NAD+ synthase